MVDSAPAEATRGPVSGPGRTVVHLALAATGIGAVVTLAFLSDSAAIHVGVGFAFTGLVLVHLVQRRRTVTRLVVALPRVTSRLDRVVRRALSDVVLVLLLVSVVVSGFVDWGAGSPVELPFPAPLNGWHKASGLVLVVYLLVHALRRRRRFFHSSIR